MMKIGHLHTVCACYYTSYVAYLEATNVRSLRCLFSFDSKESKLIKLNLKMDELYKHERKSLF
jgi:hypothetical protein